jgi:1,4-alpha-glucan branching enzyme
MIADDSENSVFAWVRRAGDANPIAVVSNFTPVPRQGYGVPLPRAGRWREILNTDAGAYGGSGTGNLGGVTATEDAGRIGAVCTLPPLATLWLEFDPAG